MSPTLLHHNPDPGAPGAGLLALHRPHRVGILIGVVLCVVALLLGPAQPAEAATVTREVTATSLNVRSGASTSHAIVGRLAKGTRISGTYSGTWFRIASGTYSGRWVSGGHLKAVATTTPTPTPAPSPSTVTREVTATSLNVRSGASTSHAIVGRLAKGTRITGTYSGTWFRIASGTFAGRWVSGGHLKAVATTTPVTNPRISRTTHAPGTTVSHTVSQQVMVAQHVSGTSGTWARWEWRGDAWYRVDADTKAAFGIGGMKPAAERIGGDYSTPIGTFTLPFAFGAGAPTGLKMPYRKTTTCSYWIGDRSQSDYNRWREDCAIPEAVAKNSEHLYYYSNLDPQRQYRQAVVIDFNYWSPRTVDPGTGAGIFLHYSGSGRTLGCVGLMNATELTQTLQWLDPAKNPRIVIK